MPSPNKEDVARLAHLCHIKISKEEEEKTTTNLKNILTYVSLLEELDTQNVTPCVHVLEGIQGFLREDKEGPCLNREEFLKNAPDHVGSMVKVPPVIQFEE